MKKILLLLALFLLSVPAAQAAFTSNFTGANANMTLSGAWDNGVPASADTARWANATYTSSANVTANQAIGKLLFASTTGNVTFGTGASTLTLNGVGGIGIQVDSGSGTVITGGAKFALGASQEWITNSANATTVNGTITNSGNTTAYTLTINGTGNITLSGIISNGGTVGTTAIAKTGAGTLTLSGTNTYAGGVTLNSGKLILGSNAALGGAAGNFTINAGTTIDVSAARTTGSNNKQNWFGDFTFAGSNTWNTGTGAVTMNATRTATVVASTMTVGGNITDSGSGFGLTKAGAGTLALTGNNTYTGATTVSVGTLQFGKIVSLYGGNETSWTASNLVVESGATAAFNVGGTGEFTSANITTLAALGSGAGGFKSGSILGLDTTTTSFAYAGNIINPNSGSNVLGLVKLGTGTLTLSGTNTYSGNTTVSAGALSFANTAAMPSSGNVTVAAGATLGLGVGGSGYFSSANVTALWGNTLAQVTMNAASLVGIDTSAGNFTYSTAQSTRGLVKLGTNTLTLDQANTFTGGMTINEGTLKYGIANALATTGNVTVNANGASTTATLDLAGFNATIGTLTMGGVGGTSSSVSQVTTGAGTLTLGGNVTTDATGNPTTAASISGNLSLGANRTFTVADSTGSAIDLDVSAVVSGTGFNNLTKAGAGTMTLNGTNTYTGKTVISAGALSINSISDVGAGSSSLGNPTTTANGTISIGTTTVAGTLIYTGSGHSSNRTIDLAGTTGGATIQAEGAGALTLTSNFTTSAATGNKTLTLTGNSTAANTIQGVIPDRTAGTAYTSLAKSGVGTWVLTGANTYTGNTTITAGTLSVSSLANAGSKSNLGNFSTSGATGLRLNGGKLQYTGATTSTDRGFTLTASSTIDVNTPGAVLTLGASSLGAFTLNATGGSGSSIALGATTLTGAAVMNATTANLTVASVSGAFNLTLNGTATGSSVAGAIATGTGTLTKNGAGTWTLSGTNTYTGNTTINAGTLVANNVSALGNYTISSVRPIAGSALDLATDVSINPYEIVNPTSLSDFTIISDRLTPGVGITHILGKLSTGEGVLNITAGSNVTSGSPAVAFGNVTLTGTGGVIDTFNPTTASVSMVNVNMTPNGFTNNQTLALDGTASGNTISGNITNVAGGTSTGFLTLTKSNASTWTLSGNNAYTGLTTISGGTLVLSGNNTAATGNVAVNGGALVLSGSGTIGASTVNLTLGGGSVDLGSTSQRVGAVFITAAASSGATIGNGSLTGTSYAASNTSGNATVSANLLANGSAGLTKSGAGTLVLTGTNTYTGNTTISAGPLLLSGSGTIGASTANLTLGGGSVDLGATSQTVGAVSITAAASSGATIGNGSLTGASYAASNTSGNATVSANLLGSAGLTMSGAGTLVLTGTNTYTGGTTVSAGALNFGTNGLGTTGNITLAGGTLQYAAASNTQDVGTRLRTSGANALKIDVNNNAVVFALPLTDGSLTQGLTLTSTTPGGSLTLNGNNTYTGNTSIGTGAGALILSGTGTLNSGNYSGAITNNSALVYESSADQILGGAITGTGSITKNGTGRLTLTANSGYTGGVTLNSGTLGLDASSGAIGSLGGTGSVLTINGGTIDSTSAAARSFTNNQIWNADLVYAGSGGVAITFTGNVTLTASRSVNVVSGGAPTVTLGGVISEGGSGYGLTKEGDGTVVMQGASTNTYTGNTTLNAGALQLRTSNKLADASSIIVNSGRLDLTETTGTQETVANVTVTGGYISASANATMNKLTATDGFHFQNADNTISANLGGGNITKTTGGTVTLSGNNTNTGTLSVDGGKLIFVKPSALYSGANASWTKPNITVNSGGTLAFTAAGAGEFTAADLSTLIANLTGDVTTGGFKAGSTIGIGTSNAVTINNAISDTTGTGGGAVGLYKYGTNGLSLTGNNTYTGDTTISAGTLTIGVGGTLGGGSYAGNILIGNTASLYVNPGAGGIQTLSGNISGNGSLRVGAGSPTVTLSGNNSYSGGTTLDTSTTVAMNKNAFGTGTIGVGISQSPTISAGADLSGPNAIMNNVSVLGSFSLAGSNNATLGGSITLNNNRSITISNNATVLLSGPIHLTDGSTSGNLTLSFSLGSGPTTISNVIDDAGTAKGIRYSFTTGALLNLTNGNSSYTGATDGFGTATGVLEVSKLADGNSTSSIGASTSDASNLVIAQSSTLRYVGGGDSTDRLFTMNGGSSTGNTLDASGTGAINFTNNGTLVYGGTANANRTLTLTGNNTGANTLSPAVANNGSGTVALTKSGTGTWVLGGANTYTGTTTVSAGTLLVNGSTSSSSSVNVSSTGTLGGNGTVEGSVSVYGILAPGNSIDTLNTGALSLTSTSTLSIELGRSGVTPVSDRTNVTGTVSLASGANLDLTLYTGLTAPVANDIFFLISNDGFDPITGVFTKLNGVAQVLSEGSSFSWNSQSWTITYLANFEGTSFTGGNDLAIQVVPEPATWALLAFSLTTVMILRRRRRD